MSGRIRTTSAWGDREAKVIEHLKSYRKLVLKHRAIQELLDLMEPSCVARITADPKSHQPGNRVEMQLVSSIEVHDQYRMNLDELQANINSIACLIRTLPDDEYTVIMRRYMLGESMETVSGKVFLSERRCWAIHGDGIRRLSERLHTSS